MNNNYDILFDGDNISPKYCERIIKRVKEYGNITLSRVYGDFSKEDKKNWRYPCIEFSIDSRQIWVNENSKNSTDMYMVTDCCFDIEKNHKIDNYVIVSGDGDFSVLVNALKKCNKKVIGISDSMKKTSKSLLNVCDIFEFLENPQDDFPKLETIKDFLFKFLEKQSKQINISAVKDLLLRQWPHFDEGNYKVKTFKSFMNLFEEKLQYSLSNGTVYVMIR